MIHLNISASGGPGIKGLYTPFFIKLYFNSLQVSIDKGSLFLSISSSLFEF